MPLALASPANSLFQAPKPAAELPHWAASAGGLKHAIAEVRKVAVVSALSFVIRKFPGCGGSGSHATKRLRNHRRPCLRRHRRREGVEIFAAASGIGRKDERGKGGSET